MTFGEQLICFRADASLRLGAGHVTRCLTLADELRRHGAACQFICREQPGDLILEITARGYSVRSLTALPEDMEVCVNERRDCQEDYERRDAEETCATLDRAPSIVVVDHYSLGINGRPGFARPECASSRLTTSPIENTTATC